MYVCMNVCMYVCMLSAMLSDAIHDDEDGIRIEFRTDGRRFNLRRFHAKTKVQEDTVRDLLFADDCDLLFADDCALNPVWTTSLGLQQLCSHNPHQEDRGHAPACTAKAICGTNHHNQH